MDKPKTETVNLRQIYDKIVGPKPNASHSPGWTNHPSGDPINRPYTEEHSWGAYADIRMRDIVARRETDVKFQQAVITFTAFAVGQGYHLTADTSTDAGEEALKICEQYAREQNLDELNQVIAMDAIATGNAFVEPIRKRKAGVEPNMQVKVVPVSSFIRIMRDEHAVVTGYVQQWSGPQYTLSPDSVLHFRWLPRDGSAWGCGLGQILAREGVGYKTASGQTVRRPSWFEIAEMIDDVVPKHVYAGLPRFDIQAKNVKPESLSAIGADYDRLDPGQHMVHNYETNIKTIALDTQSRQDSFLRRIDDQLLTGNMTPISKMWSALNFTYASADAAIEAYLPLIRMYQRAHKRFVEMQLLNPMLMDYLEQDAVDEANVQLVWGPQDPLTAEDIAKIWNVMKDQKFNGLYDPNDVLDMLRAAGASGLKVVDKTDQMVADELAEIEEMQGKAAPPKDELDEMRLKILQKITRRGNLV